MHQQSRTKFSILKSLNGSLVRCTKNRLNVFLSKFAKYQKKIKKKEKRERERGNSTTTKRITQDPISKIYFNSSKTKSRFELSKTEGEV